MVLERLRWKLKLIRWHRKKISKLKTADIVLLRYPKSGVTWLRVMVSEIYRVRLGLPPSHLIGSNEFSEVAPSVPQLVVANENMGIPQDAVRHHLRGRKTILLVRDPRDIVVSLYFHFSKRATKLEHLSYEIPKNVREDSLFAFAVNPFYGLPKIIEFMNYWSSALRNDPNGLILRYEDLRASPNVELQKLMDIISPGTTQAEIQDAVDFATFEKMKVMESDGSFGVDILKPGDDSDSDSFKVRRGKVGGYVDYLSDEERQKIDGMIRNRLDTLLGYR